MIKWNEIKQAAHQMVHHRMRTALTLLGMVFGVGAVVAMQNIGEGAERAALKTIERMGLYSIVIDYVPESIGSDEERELSIGLSQAEVELMVKSLEFVDSYSASSSLDVEQTFSDFGGATPSVKGVTYDYLSQSAQQISRGRNFVEEDFDAYAQTAILGEEVARDLFPEGNAIGGTIKVNALWFTVIGVLASQDEVTQKVEGIKLGGERNRIFVPMSTFQLKLRSTTDGSEYQQVKLHLDSSVNQSQVASYVDKMLTRRHGGLKDYRITVPADLLAQHQETQKVFNWVMSAVAGISLLVGGIGIMNIMLATVLERTQEIGLRRAIGATKTDITRQFLIETLVITAVGALLGIVFGIFLSVLIASLANWDVAFSASAILIAVLVCAFVGLAFGIYPAKRAAQLNPIEALQHA